jgi:hypothetical protein
MKAPVIACLLLVLAGCATQGSAVRCDGRLEPINMSSKAVQESSSASPAVSLNQAEGES